ncbi:MAG: hypothetical protein AAF576_04710 [Pseudomonadota bacterium]
MLEDKRKDLDAEKKKKLLQRLLSDLSAEDPNVYYMATADVAAIIKKTIETGGRLSADDRTLLKGLSQRDIEVILSLH